MAARKRWADLSDNYRHRLTRKGVTAESHAAGAPLAHGRGHGRYTPSERRRNATRRPETSEKRFTRQAMNSGVKLLDINTAMDTLGIATAGRLLGWRNLRHDMWEANGHNPAVMSFHDYAVDNGFPDDGEADAYLDHESETEISSWAYYH